MTSVSKLGLVFAGSILTAVTPAVLAHTGHDHSAPMAGLIHLLWFAPLVIACAYGVFRLTNPNRAKIKDK